MTHINAMSGRDTISKEQKNLTMIIQQVLDAAKKQGANSAEVAASVETGFTVNVRMGEIDTVEHQRNKGIGITVYFGHKKGSASSSDIRSESLQETLAKACNIAKYTQEDEFSGLADKALMASDYPDLELYHPWDITPTQAVEQAKLCEAKALALGKRITNSEGASISSHQSMIAYGNSHGFIGAYPASRHNITLILIAKEGQSMERDYSYTIGRDHLDLESINKIAKEAAYKTIHRLNARKLSTRKAPVIFDAEIASGLLGCFVNAIRGGNLYRKASFLVDHLEKPVFPSHINIIEQPSIKKGLGSSPFDAEGIKLHDRDIVKDGILKSYVLSSYSARKLGMQTTGNAGGIHNWQISTSDKDKQALLKYMGTGLLVTELMGQGINIVTGDYSRGATGFWVENGEIQFPVHEITIAGNLKAMFQNIELVGNDIDYRSNIRTGSLLLREMMIAGE